MRKGTFEENISRTVVTYFQMSALRIVCLHSAAADECMRRRKV